MVFDRNLSVCKFYFSFFQGIEWKSINQSDFGKHFRHFAKSKDIHYSEMMKSLRYCLCGKKVRSSSIYFLITLNQFHIQVICFFVFKNKAETLY